MKVNRWGVVGGWRKGVVCSGNEQNGILHSNMLSLHVGLRVPVTHGVAKRGDPSQCCSNSGAGAPDGATLNHAVPPRPPLPDSLPPPQNNTTPIKDNGSEYVFNFV